MSYCRFSDGDVYLYADVQGGWTCCGCSLIGGPSGMRHLDSAEDVLAHFQHHERAGDRVPDYAIARIKDEIATPSTSVRDK